MLELKKITKTFNLTGNKEDFHIALDNLNFKVGDGEFVTIIGSNGGGKSTTMNIITGVLKPDKGQVLLNGVDITKKSEHERARYFGRVFQDPMMGTAPDMSVIENLEVAYRRGRYHSPIRWGFSKKNKELFVKELKRFDLGLEDRLTQKVGLMSGGQRQALTLLMASLRNKIPHSMIKKDYITFSNKDKDVAKKEFEDNYNAALAVYKENLLKLKDISDRKLRKEEKEKYYDEFDKKVRKFDLAKQILLLDEHTAALDPKTAKKVLDLTDRIVKENGLTTLMITHNMKDAITYGTRLVMFSHGKLIADFKGEEKKKLTQEKLMELFEKANMKLS